MANKETAPEAFLFQGANLVVPGDMEDRDAFGGLPRDRIRTFFAEAPAYFEVPHLAGEGAIGSFLLPPKAPLPPGWRKMPIRQSLAPITEGILDGSGRAGYLFRTYHIMQWRRDSVFCGTCGTANGDAPGELARLCPSCGRMEFPRISPAVIVLIINDREEALLAHNRNFAGGVYSLIAGFNEAGENLEATIIREIREEVSLEVRDIRYRASQPWPFPNSLMLGFTARYASGILKPDGVEIEDARWFSRDRLPKLPGPGSVSRHLIEKWLDRALQ
jgi:NAD+ diphosphatase